MVHRNISEGQKSRPRGRPRKHDNRLENSENEVLASPGHRIGAKRGDIATKEIKPVVGDSNALPVDSNEAAEPKGEESKPNLIDCIEIKEGGNVVKITLTKQKNRMIRLQMFFNDTEIRPSTFTGMSPAQNYWTLLKDKHKQK